MMNLSRMMNMPGFYSPFLQQNPNQYFGTGNYNLSAGFNQNNTFNPIVNQSYLNLMQQRNFQNNNYQNFSFCNNLQQNNMRMMNSALTDQIDNHSDNQNIPYKISSQKQSYSQNKYSYLDLNQTKKNNSNTKQLNKSNSQNLMIINPSVYQNQKEQQNKSSNTFQIQPIKLKSNQSQQIQNISIERVIKGIKINSSQYISSTFNNNLGNTQNQKTQKVSCNLDLNKEKSINQKNQIIIANDLVNSKLSLNNKSQNIKDICQIYQKKKDQSSKSGDPLNQKYGNLKIKQ